MLTNKNAMYFDIVKYAMSSFNNRYRRNLLRLYTIVWSTVAFEIIKWVLLHHVNRPEKDRHRLFMVKMVVVCDSLVPIYPLPSMVKFLPLNCISFVGFNNIGKNKITVHWFTGPVYWFKGKFNRVMISLIHCFSASL